MKIATFNINGINKRLGNLLTWLAAAKPDVVCLQELKATQDEFPDDVLSDAGYRSAFVGQHAWNGVAILSRKSEPVVTRAELAGDVSDKQARYLEAAVNGVIVGCLYAPNGNPQPGPKFDYKLSWHKRFTAHAAGLLKTGMPVVLAGDFNIVPEPRDVYATTSYDDNALVQPKSRAAFAQLMKQGWVDVVRHAFGDETVYTFWDYRRKRWERNAGLRIDHILVTPSLTPRLKQVGIDRDVRGEAEASDHAPVWVRLARA